MRENNNIPRSVAKKKIEELKNNAGMRRSLAKRFKIKTDVPVGASLRSLGRETLTVLKSGYRRKRSDGRTEIFDKKGKLTSVTWKNGRRVDINYEKGKNRPRSIGDDKGNQFFFKWKTDGLVKNILSNKKKAVYAYDKNHNLKEAKDIW